MTEEGMRVPFPIEFSEFKEGLGWPPAEIGCEGEIVRHHAHNKWSTRQALIAKTGLLRWDILGLVLVPYERGSIAIHVYGRENEARLTELAGQVREGLGVNVTVELERS